MALWPIAASAQDGRADPARNSDVANQEEILDRLEELVASITEAGIIAFDEYTDLIPSPESRRHHWTQIRPIGDRQWEVQQTLMDPLLDNFWGIRARVDLRRATSVEVPLLKIETIAK